ncbi:MAG: PAS domain S-box protein [Halarcobacter sp.]
MMLSKYSYILKEKKIDILRHWVKDKEVSEILEKHDISLKVFLKQYALLILNSYIKSIENNKDIIECEVLEDFLVLLKDRGISTSEFFLFFSAFKNSIIYCFNQKEVLSYELIDEITCIHEKNFVKVLKSYSRRIKDFEIKLNKSESLIHEYIIISTTDTKGIITDVTQAFCDISGYTKDELIGKNHNILNHPDTKEEVFKELWNTITKGDIWHGEIKNKKKDGSSFWVDIRVMPQFNEDSIIESFHAVSQDITPQKELEEQQDILIEQSKSAAMGEMISMIAHQWRQPLQAVSILSQKLPISMMTDGKISEKLLNQVIGDIAKQLNYMSKTIDDFRDFFMPNKIKDKISIQEIINRTLDFMAFMFKTDGIKINVEKQKDIVLELYVNETIQVLINILKNSRDVLLHRDIKDKIINIKYYKEKNNLILQIEDNAGGIDKAFIKKVFEPYFSTKNDKNGTGLGLYMCKTIIEKHCLGKLSVSNSKLGAIFTIELPL